VKSSHPPSNDADLVRLAQNGNRQACNQLLARYNQKIKHVVSFHIDDHAHANDLAQDVLVKIVRYLPTFKEESVFSTWMYRITMNTIKNHFRSTNLRSCSEARYANEQQGSVYSSPEYHLMRMELDAFVETAVGQLSEELRLCYSMHLFEGQSYEAIAQKMQCPIGTVRSRIFRARKLIVDWVGHNPKLSS